MRASSGRAGSPRRDNRKPVRGTVPVLDDDPDAEPAQQRRVARVAGEHPSCPKGCRRSRGCVPRVAARAELASSSRGRRCRRRRPGAATAPRASGRQALRQRARRRRSLRPRRAGRRAAPRGRQRRPRARRLRRAEGELVLQEHKRSPRRRARPGRGRRWGASVPGHGLHAGAYSARASRSRAGSRRARTGSEQARRARAPTRARAERRLCFCNTSTPRPPAATSGSSQPR